MKTLLLVFTTFASFYLFGQHPIPKNLKQAVDYLEKDCPNNVKERIKTIAEDSLEYAVYPYSKDSRYDIIYRWTTDDDNNKISIYLDRKKIYSYHFEVILYAFREKLLNGKINTKAILNKFLEKERQLEEKKKIKYITDSIDGVYIPKNLEDCFAQLNLFLKDSVIEKIKITEEDQFVARSHLGLGMWIRNNWRLWGGSRLSEYFNKMGIYHPDVISGIILEKYHKSLNNKEINLEKTIKSHQEFLEKTRREKLEEIKKVFSEYKIGDTLYFNYNKGFVSDLQEEKYYDESCIAKGIITQRNENEFIIKVKIIESCDRKGIIYYKERGWSTQHKRWKKSSRWIIKRVKRNRQQWFNYEDWDLPYQESSS